MPPRSSTQLSEGQELDAWGRQNNGGMSNIAETLRHCHEIVWRYRAQLEPYWKIPSTEDCLLFAFTELGEAVDAHLRSKPEYARNRDKDLSVLDELADCALMVLSALGPEWEFKKPSRRRSYVQSETMWGDMMRALIWLIDFTEDGASLDRGEIDIILIKIATVPGMDLPARLTARLDRIASKQLPQTEPMP